MLDGEAVLLGVDGYSDFNASHSGKHDDEVQFCDEAARSHLLQGDSLSAGRLLWSQEAWVRRC